MKQDIHRIRPGQSAGLGGHPAEATFAALVEGCRRFREQVFPEQRALFQRLARSQAPRTLFITCADSRVAPELITQSAPGDLFVTRNVGNLVPAYGQMNGGVSTAIEYAVLALGVQHIIVCGHSDCGAMKAVLAPETLGPMPTVRAWLRHAEVARSLVERNCTCATHDTLGVLTEENVVAQLDHLRTHPAVAARLAAGQLFIHGWVYDIETAAIRAYDAETGGFRPLEEASASMATPRPRYLAS
ncbi:carbonic anhydrase [Metapseudomonas otitidis]|uniref:carbonic anhydrase n=1 Tax=Metapseudomonas otitidis TaxID=319939 RepID=UPI002097E490|nr:carbonic anhydrase [Pseudomonas otitidis]MCO7553208.1 carbonic anhydrase [Pseudomonas otitidis]WAF85931.1 carbonic anhydrase [Pseudomonas otitidis]